MDLRVQAGMGGSNGGSISVSDELFGAQYNEPLVHQVVTAFLAGSRAGTKAQKSRAQVRGGGRKPWRQKGTGRARAGSSRSPLWRKGGVSFAAVPRDYTQKVNRKMYRGAMRSILSELIRQGRLNVIDALSLPVPKTKALVEKLTVLGLHEVLIVEDEVDRNLFLAARNLPKVAVCEVASVDPVSLLGFENVVLTEAALRQMENKLG